MEQSPPWATDSCTPTQELPSILLNPKVHYRVHNSSPLDPILSQINPAHSTSSYVRFKSIFLTSGRLCNGFFQGRGPLWHFVTSLFLRRGVVSPMPNPQAGGPPLVGCPPLLIQYIRSYTWYLETVSSILNLRTLQDLVTGTHLA
jgi:hypothetical protein